MTGGAALTTSTLLLWTLTAFAAFWDLRHRRIPNSLVAVGLVAGAVVRLQADGTHGLMGGLAGALVALGLYLIPFAMRKVGGGDVKLAMACGMFLGAASTLWLVLYATALNGLLAITMLIGRRLIFGGGPPPERWTQVPKAVAFAAAVLIITLAPPP